MKTNLDKYEYLKKSMDFYYLLSSRTWEEIKKVSSYMEVKKGDILCPINSTPSDLFFVNKGLLRAYVIDEKGVEYNKTFFNEGTFPASIVALLKNRPSEFEIEALEDCELIKIDFKRYRQLLLESEDLKLFHIFYLEKNWLIKTESKDVSFVQKNAQERYEDFLENYSDLESRLTQYHIASHLGITPTQLSRIRKNL